MSSLKSKSSAKKRFSLTGTGKVRIRHAKKRHNARKLSSRSRKVLSKTATACKDVAKIIKKYVS